MEELTEVITAAEFHPKECNLFVYSSSKGIIRLCDMRQSALCDNQAKSRIQFFLINFGTPKTVILEKIVLLKYINELRFKNPKSVLEFRHQK